MEETQYVIFWMSFFLKDAKLTEGMAERYDYGLHCEMLAVTCLSLSTL